MIAIFRRDLRAYFTTPVGYIFMGIFLAVSGGVFSLFTLQKGENSDVASYFSMMVFVLAIMIPLLTMRAFCDEKKLHTEQLLLTSPISLGGMVFGKFLAVYTMFSGTFLVSSLQLLLLEKYGSPNSGKLFGSIFALLLLGAAFCAVGIFVSSLTENQVVAGVLTIALLAVFLLIGMLNDSIPFAFLREILNWISIYSRYANFTYGVFDYNAVLYYVSICFVFLFLTVRVYERRRWA